MELIELMRYRRSIRKYNDKQISKEDLKKIIEAGTYAPSAEGGQRSIIVGIHNKDLTTAIGKINMNSFSKENLAGSYVSKEQPSVIDDSSIKNGFYNAPSVCIVFAQKNFLFSIPDSFCIVQNMALMATELGISSCIVSRAEETFNNEIGQSLLNKWNIPKNYIARCFLTLGYCNGEYPNVKQRKENRIRIVED